VEIRWLGGRSLHTTRSIAQIFVGVVFNVSPHLYDVCVFVADLIACRLSHLMSAVACRPGTPRMLESLSWMWSGFLVWLLEIVPVAPSRMV
jgi:hypothetical protein